MLFGKNARLDIQFDVYLLSVQNEESFVLPQILQQVHILIGLGFDRDKFFECFAIDFEFVVGGNEDGCFIIEVKIFLPEDTNALILEDDSIIH